MQQNSQDLNLLIQRDAESKLLLHVGEELKKFFDPKIIRREHYHRDETKVLVKEVAEDNPFASVPKFAQVNVIANVTFHLLAQQLALFFISQPQESRSDIYEVAFGNIRALTAQYLKQIKEEIQNETNGEGRSGGENSSDVGVSSLGGAGQQDQDRV
jgi:hypothetical protein